MKKEYDFSKAERVKSCIPIEEMDIPIYLDKDIRESLNKICPQRYQNLEKLVNDLLRKDIEMIKNIL